MRNLKKGTTALLTLTVVGAGMLANAGIVAAQDDELIVGVSWNNFKEERWAETTSRRSRRPSRRPVRTYISTDAASDADAAAG